MSNFTGVHCFSNNWKSRTLGQTYSTFMWQEVIVGGRAADRKIYNWFLILLVRCHKQRKERGWTRLSYMNRVFIWKRIHDAGFSGTVCHNRQIFFCVFITKSWGLKPKSNLLSDHLVTVVIIFTSFETTINSVWVETFLGFRHVQACRITELNNPVTWQHVSYILAMINKIFLVELIDSYDGEKHEILQTSPNLKRVGTGLEVL